MTSSVTPSLGCVFSGIQPSGTLHLGNYLGAVQQWVELQDRAEQLIFCVVDLHALTVWQDPAELRENTLSLAASLLACGLDPAKCLLFPQSWNSDHSELAWLLNCVARFGWIQRMTQFKEKTGKNREHASLGLFAYPTLMAADILAYPTNAVPVGDDQRQHLELAREIAIRFNHEYPGADADAPPLLIPPDTLTLPVGARVMSLKDGTKKMSKSDASALSRIDLTDSADQIAEKIRKARTDPAPVPDSIDELAVRPEVTNLLGIYAGMAGTSLANVIDEYAGKPFSVFKPALTELLDARLSPIRTRAEQWRADPDGLRQILRSGAERAQEISHPRLTEIKYRMGLATG